MRRSSTKEASDTQKLKIRDPIFVDRQSKGNSGDSSHSHVSGSIKTDNNNTLGSLTRKFVDLIKNATNQTIQIHEASQKLGIQKRRIYDITNVLEGIGYIEKLGKNLMKWVGGVEGSELQKQLVQILKSIEQIQLQTKLIENEIAECRKRILQKTQQNKEMSYIKKQEIYLLMRKLSVDKLLLYTGALGDHIQSDSNPQTGATKLMIQSCQTETSIYYCNFKDAKIQSSKPLYENQLEQNICSSQLENKLRLNEEINSVK